MVPRLYSYKDCAPAAIQALTFVVNGGFFFAPAALTRATKTIKDDDRLH